jgi:NAD(P)-dependent dehydrogenase (short-subunit alcohol dehydrogenase family)
MAIIDLKDKHVVVTGACGILGSSFVRALATEGAHVAVVDLNFDAAKSLCDEVNTASDVNCIPIVCDITDPASVTRMIEEVLTQYSGIDVLLNNAAGKSSDLKQFFAPFEDYSLSQWREIMSVNIDGMFLVAQAVGKQMIAQGKGSIIQTSSIYGVVAPDQSIYKGSSYLGGEINTPAVYSASKAAVLGLTRYLATYWADKGIRVNSISPGGVESGQNDTFKENYSRRVPMGRMAQADELVGAILYLASDASSYVTGQNLIVDGGLSAR